MKHILTLMVFFGLLLDSPKGTASRYERFIPPILKESCKDCKVLTSSKANAFNDDIHREYQLQCSCKDDNGMYLTSLIKFSNPIQLLSSDIINCNGHLCRKKDMKPSSR